MAILKDEPPGSLLQTDVNEISYRNYNSWDSEALMIPLFLAFSIATVRGHTHVDADWYAQKSRGVLIISYTSLSQAPLTISTYCLLIWWSLNIVLSELAQKQQEHELCIYIPTSSKTYSRSDLVCVHILCLVKGVAKKFYLPSYKREYYDCTSLIPRPSEGGGGGKAWYPLHAHALLLFRFRLHMDTAPCNLN